MEKKTVLENLDLILLAMDETVDGGCVLEYLYCLGYFLTKDLQLFRLLPGRSPNQWA